MRIPVRPSRTELGIAYRRARNSGTGGLRCGRGRTHPVPGDRPGNHIRTELRSELRNSVRACVTMFHGRVDTRLIVTDGIDFVRLHRRMEKRSHAQARA